MHPFRQTLAVCAWNFRTLRSRARSVFVAVVGFFGVVLVFVAVLSIRDGLTRGLSASSSDSVAVIYSKRGSIDNTVFRTIIQARGVAQSAEGPLIAGTLISGVEMPKWAPGFSAQAIMRGIGPQYAKIQSGFRITKGRMFRLGLDEIIVGQTAEQLFAGLSIGDSLKWNHHNWKVVGIFATGSSMHDSEILADVRQLQGANNAGDHYSSILARLTSAGAFPAFKASLERYPQLNINVERESAYDLQFVQYLNAIIVEADGIITLLMAVGAVFATLNIMYANVASRMGEIAIFRALGFTRSSILVAVLAEAITLALVGGGLGVLVAFLVFDGFEASTTAGGLIGFKFAVTPAAIGIAAVLTCVMGLLGGLFPSIFAARLPLAKALREC